MTALLVDEMLSDAIAGPILVTHRAFPHDRSYVGALVSSPAALHHGGGLPRPGAETFLPRLSCRAPDVPPCVEPAARCA